MFFLRNLVFSDVFDSIFSYITLFVYVVFNLKRKFYVFSIYMMYTTTNELTITNIIIVLVFWGVEQDDYYCHSHSHNYNKNTAREKQR